MKTKKQAVLVIYDESDVPIAVVTFQGKSHTFHNLERMGMDEIEGLLNRNLPDRKLPPQQEDHG